MSLLAALALAADAIAAGPICTDRPAKANAVCTVLGGRFQLETGLTGWRRTGTGGIRSTSLQLGSSLLKIGLSDGSDLQVGFTPASGRRSNRRTEVPGHPASATCWSATSCG